MKPTRKDQKENTKMALYKAAYNLFSQQGILNTRMSDIAQAAGVSHGTVFLHFSSQEALITEVITFYCGKIALRTHELSDSHGSLRELLSAHLNGIGEFEAFYTRLVIENRLLPTEARDAWITTQAAISFHFSQAVENEGCTSVPLHMLFTMWMGLVHYYLSNGDLFAPEGNVIQRYKSELMENFLKLIEPQKRE